MDLEIKLKISKPETCCEDFSAFFPIDIRLLWKIKGHDRPDYYFARPESPISYNGGTYNHLVLSTHDEKDSLIGFLKPIAAHIALVTDDSALEDASLNSVKIENVAVCLIERRERRYDALRKLAHIGNAEAQYFLARCYYDGAECTKNNNKALWWLKESANKGFYPAKKLLYNL